MDFENTLNKHGDIESIDTIYHYTNISGFNGIFKPESEVLWATDTRYLNDKVEFIHGIELFRREIGEALKEYADRDFFTSHNDCTKYLHDFESRTFDQLDWIETSCYLNKSHTYCVSFSADNGNRLSQWRGYGKEVGVSIGFDVKILYTEAIHQGFRLMKCLYTEEDKRKFINDALREFFGFFCDQSENIENYKNLEKFSLMFRNMLAFLAPALKHEDFSEEKEWRLVHSYSMLPNSKIKFQFNGGYPKPYIEFHHHNIPIHHVTLGPHKDSNCYLTILNTLERRNLYSAFKKSKTPLRV